MEEKEYESNRRQFLAAGALCGMAGVAGCSGLLGGGSDDLSVEETAIPDPTEPERSEYGQNNALEFFATIENQGDAGEVGYAVSYSEVRLLGPWNGTPGEPAFESFEADERKEVTIVSAPPSEEGESAPPYYAFRVWASGITATVSNSAGEAKSAEVVLLDGDTEVTSTTQEIGADETVDIELRREEVPEESPGDLSVEVSEAS